MEFEPLLNELLVTIVVAVVSILAKYAVDFLKAKKDQILSNETVSEYGNTIAYVIDLVTKVVDKVTQTYVDDLKKEGKFTPENQEEALRRALDEIKSMLTDSSRELLGSLYGDVDKWLRLQVEAHLHQQHAAQEALT